LTLNTGAVIPQLGFGTSPLNDVQAADAVEAAIGLGYRHIDTAMRYFNETGVGEGIRRSGIDRGELFVTTKLEGSSRATTGRPGGAALAPAAEAGRDPAQPQPRAHGREPRRLRLRAQR
jgi:2,5-diketo-D-gluconate reductase A